MLRKTLRRASGGKFTPTAAALMLAGCGTVVPDYQEFPNDRGQGQILVNAIAQSVHCELRDSIAALYKEWRAAKKYNDQQLAALWKYFEKNPEAKATYLREHPGARPPGLSNGFKKRRPIGFIDDDIYFDDWGAAWTLTLTVAESTTVNPTTSVTPHGAVSSVFSLGLGATGSSEATRIDTMSFFETVQSLKYKKGCKARPEIKDGSLLLQSDLKLRDWLAANLMIVAIGGPPDTSLLPAKDALVHHVKFQVVTSGQATPSWKLVETSVDGTGTLFSTKRDRTHDLVITFGPASKDQLAGAAGQIHAAQVFGVAFSNNLPARTPR